jgi:hypothetical protein
VLVAMATGMRAAAHPRIGQMDGWLQMARQSGKTEKKAGDDAGRESFLDEQADACIAGGWRASMA